MRLNLRKFTFILVVLLLAAAILPSSARATTLREYREKVSGVRETLDSLVYANEYLSETENQALQKEYLKQIRTMLPANDKIELPNGAFDVDNRWLYIGLQRYEAQSFESIERAKIIGELAGKIAALEIKLVEVENQSAAARTKDEDKRKLGEILNRPEYQKPAEKGESVIQKAIAAFFNWLDEVFPRPEINAPSEQAVQTYKPILQIVVLLVALGIIGFLLYRFAPILFKNFRQREKREKQTRVILGETLAADATAQNLFGEAEALARAGDLRAAIRKGYIALLCELSDRKVIGLARHKTNRDYLRDVRHHGNLHREMRGLTTSFERHWYGAAQTAAADWEDFKRQYRETVGTSV